MDSVSYITLETLQNNEPTYAFFGALFSIGAQLLGGLLSKPKAPTPAPAPQVVKVVETKQTPNIQEGVDAAKKAGFNPASAARMGLIQGFITNETPFLTSNPDYVNWQANNNYQQQKSGWLGNMFSSVGSAASQWGSFKQNQQRLDQQSRLIDSEIYRNYSTGRQNYFKPAQWAGAQTEWHHAKNNAPVPLGQPVQFEVGDVKVTNPWPDHLVDPNRADAEAIETRYGELAAEGYGLWNVAADTYYNYFGNSADTGQRTNIYPTRFVTSYNRPQNASEVFKGVNTINTSGGGW